MPSVGGGGATGIIGLAANGFGDSPEDWILVGLAAFGWLLAVVGVAMFVRARRRGRPPAWPREERPPPAREFAAEPRAAEPAAPSPRRPPVGRLLDELAPENDAIGGVLRWLLLETEAEAVGYVELGPGGRELFRAEPRGLDPATLARLAGRARDALVLPEGTEPALPDGSVVRWLGAGGSKGIIATGVAREGVDESLRFARFLLEWARASRSEQRPFGLEEAIREIPGVAWAEEDEGGQAMRVLLAESADVSETRAAVEGLLGEPGVRVLWLEAESAPGAGEPAEVPAEAEPERRPSRLVQIPEAGEVREAGPPETAPGIPRVRLLDVKLDADGRATAEVRAEWKDQELRGRGHGRSSTAGRYYAAAEAMADALRPLLDTDVLVEGLYSASVRDGVDVLIAEVVLEGDRLVGAVVERAEIRDWSGARAVLDAVNRRLAQVAGRSGRI